MDGVTTVFIGNLPEGCSRGMLAKIFEVYGALWDVYVPAKKDRCGKVFAFVRYKKVVDKKVLLAKMNRVTIDGVRIRANIARYGRVTKQTYEDTKKRGWDWRPTGSMIVELNQIGDVEVEGWIGRAVVAEAWGLDELSKTVEWLQSLGIDYDRVKYIGGMKVLVIYKTKESTRFFLTAKKHATEKMFRVFNLWMGQNIPYDRVAWLRVFGMPIKLWGEENFWSIAKMFSRPLLCSETSLWGGEMSFAMVGVLMDSNIKVDEMVRIARSNCKIMVVESIEVWVPDWALGECVNKSGKAGENREEQNCGKEDCPAAGDTSPGYNGKSPQGVLEVDNSHGDVVGGPSLAVVDGTVQMPARNLDPVNLLENGTDGLVGGDGPFSNVEREDGAFNDLVGENSFCADHRNVQGNFVCPSTSANVEDTLFHYVAGDVSGGWVILMEKVWGWAAAICPRKTIWWDLSLNS